MNSFRKGLVDALPVFLGYLAVGFTFGIASAPAWKSATLPVLASAISLSGTGQFILLELISAGSSAAAIIAGTVAINLRYFPMAIAVGQRLDPGMPLWRRLVVAMADTDEDVGISLRQNPPLGFEYMAGLLFCSWSGWVGGTILGANPGTQSLLPPLLLKALGMSMPAMFAAIVFPAFRESKRTRVAIVLAVAASLTLRALPCRLDPGWVTLGVGLLAAGAAAALFPKKAGEEGGA